MKPVNKIGEELCWEIPDGEGRQMGLLCERDITPTKNMSAGSVRIPAGGQQVKLSKHTCEEIYFIFEGKARFFLGDEQYEVEKGNTVYVAPGTGHRTMNIGDEDLVLYWVNSPPVFGDAEGYKEFVKDWTQIR